MKKLSARSEPPFDLDTTKVDVDGRTFRLRIKRSTGQLERAWIFGNPDRALLKDSADWTVAEALALDAYPERCGVLNDWDGKMRCSRPLGHDFSHCGFDSLGHGTNWWGGER